jgi:hypothetical protein
MIRDTPCRNLNTSITYGYGQHPGALHNQSSQNLDPNYCKLAEHTQARTLPLKRVDESLGAPNWQQSCDRLSELRS